MRLSRGLALASLLAVVAAGMVSPMSATAARPPADPFGEITPIIVVLDISGSMSSVITGENSNGGRRIDAAQAAVLDVISAIPTGQSYGMIAYPGRDSRVVDGCAIGNVETALGLLDVPAASAAVRRMVADGGTPTGPALQHASDLIRNSFGDAVGGVIVLVSDGQSNCGTPPCEVAQAIRAAGLDVQVNTVGLEINGAGEDELKCIADATGGRYVSANDPEALQEAIGAAAQARISVAVTAPTSVPVVTGTGDAGGGFIAVTVRSTGRVAAADVRVSLSVSFDGDSVGSVLVPLPVRFLGNINTGDELEFSFNVRPDDRKSGSATWSVSATARNAAPQVLTGSVLVSDRLSPEGLGAVLDGVTRVAVVGDSYSSGEGATGHYLEGTDGGKDGSKCHRSDSTYAAQIWGQKNVELIACSGAVTSDFYSSQRSGGKDVPPQLQTLRDAAMGKNPPQAVLLSIGGNDAGFSDVAKACILAGFLGTKRCDKLEITPLFGETITAKQALLGRGAAIRNDVATVLRSIDSAINDRDAIANRGGKVAPIILIPYPRIIPDTSRFGASPGGCMIGMAGSEIALLNDYFDAINDAMKVAAKSLSTKNRPVYFAADVIDAFQPDHTICEGGNESYAVFDSWDKVRDSSDFVYFRDKSELLHPTITGHRAMARAISAWSNSPTTRPVSPPDTPVWDPGVIRGHPPFLNMIWGDSIDMFILRTTAGGTQTVHAKGFMPQSRAVVRVDSVPTVVGTAIASDSGDLSLTFWVPEELPAGTHHVRIFGIDPEWQPIVISQELQVLPAGGPWLIFATVGGLILALFGGLGLLIVRRRTANLPGEQRPPKLPKEQGPPKPPRAQRPPKPPRVQRPPKPVRAGEL